MSEQETSITEKTEQSNKVPKKKLTSKKGTPKKSTSKKSTSKKSTSKKKTATKKTSGNKTRTKHVERCSIVLQLKLSDIVVEKNNPRQHYSSEGLRKLALSFKEVGMLQALTVRTKPDSAQHYLVTGERRYRAAKLAKLPTVPCVVHPNMTDGQVAYAQHIENAHRENLNPVEFAQSIANFIGHEIQIGDKTIKVNAKTAAEQLGLSQGAISQYLSLLKLPNIMQDALRKGKVSFAQARELCSPALSPKKRESLFQAILSGEVKKAADIREAVEKIRATNVIQKGESTQANDSPSTRQNLDTALQRLRTITLNTRTKAELREGLAMIYERHARAKDPAKQQFLKGFAAALEWTGGLREKI